MYTFKVCPELFDEGVNHISPLPPGGLQGHHSPVLPGCQDLWHGSDLLQRQGWSNKLTWRNISKILFWRASMRFVGLTLPILTTWRTRWWWKGALNPMLNCILNFEWALRIIFKNCVLQDWWPHRCDPICPLHEKHSWEHRHRGQARGAPSVQWKAVPFCGEAFGFILNLLYFQHCSDRDGRRFLQQQHLCWISN